jgi:hypothetical protein
MRGQAPVFQSEEADNLQLPEQQNFLKQINKNLSIQWHLEAWEIVNSPLILGASGILIPS